MTEPLRNMPEPLATTPLLKGNLKGASSKAKASNQTATNRTTNWGGPRALPSVCRAPLHGGLSLSKCKIFPPPQAGEGAQPSFFDRARGDLNSRCLRQRRLFQRLSILSLLLGIVLIGLG
jgi:hypothetical protein